MEKGQGNSQRKEGKEMLGNKREENSGVPTGHFTFHVVGNRRVHMHMQMQLHLEDDQTHNPGTRIFEKTHHIPAKQEASVV
jgi:hypothetical protein